jgi:hypothetical protein
MHVGRAIAIAMTSAGVLALCVAMPTATASGSSMASVHAGPEGTIAFEGRDGLYLMQPAIPTGGLTGASTSSPTGTTTSKAIGRRTGQAGRGFRERSGALGPSGSRPMAREWSSLTAVLRRAFLLSARRDGSDSKRVLRGTQEIVNPTWSPDGQWITFSMGAGERYDVYILRTDGRDLTLWGAKILFTPRDHPDLQAEPSADPHADDAENRKVDRRVTLTAPSDLRATSEIRLPTRGPS